MYITIHCYEFIKLRKRDVLSRMYIYGKFVSKTTNFVSNGFLKSFVHCIVF